MGRVLAQHVKELVLGHQHHKVTKEQVSQTERLTVDVLLDHWFENLPNALTF